MPSECPYGEGVSRGKRRVMVNGGRICWSMRSITCAEVGDVFKGGILCGVKIMAGLFLCGERAFVPSVYFR